MKPPVIAHVRNTGRDLIATVEGREVPLTTFRQTLWRQGLVYLPPPFTDRCPPMPCFNIPGDDESHMSYIGGCILDHEVAKWMKEFATGTLKTGKLR